MAEPSIEFINKQSTAARELEQDEDKKKAYHVITTVFNIAKLKSHNIKVDKTIDQLNYYVISFTGDAVKEISLKGMYDLANDEYVLGIHAQPPEYKEHPGINLYVEVFYAATVKVRSKECMEYRHKKAEKWQQAVKYNSKLLENKELYREEIISFMNELIYSDKNPFIAESSLQTKGLCQVLTLYPISQLDIRGVLLHTLSKYYGKNIESMVYMIAEDWRNQLAVEFKFADSLTSKKRKANESEPTDEEKERDNDVTVQPKKKTGGWFRLRWPSLFNKRT